MRKYVFVSHPLMIFKFLKPFLFVLVLPVIKGALQYLIYRRISGVLTLEIVAFAAILFFAVLRFKAFKVILTKENLTVNSGVFFKSVSVIPLGKISCAVSSRSPIDALFGSVTFRINTEAGNLGRPDFQFKLNLRQAKLLTNLIYSKPSQIKMRFSPARIAAMSAAASSALTGLIIGVPLINRIGRLIGVSVSNMLIYELDTVSKKINTYFPPIVNVVTIVFIVAYLFSFLVALLRNARFRLGMSEDKIETEAGFFIRKKTVFKKSAVNNIIFEQTPMMRLINMITVQASVAGFGGSRGEKATLIPCGRRDEVNGQMSLLFSGFNIISPAVRAPRSRKTMWRFLFFPRVYALLILLISSVLHILFPYFKGLTLFLTIISLIITAYYAYVCLLDYKYGRLCVSKRLCAVGSRRLTSRKLCCDTEKIGVIKISRTPADRVYSTCKVKLTVRSESADSIRVRNIKFDDLTEMLEKIIVYSEDGGA